MYDCKVSIVIPVYNAEKYIEDNIRSLIVQSYTNFEIIYVDDGSIDDTASIIKYFSQKDKRINYIFQKNKGAGAARNRGMEYANGKYSIFLDADDFFHPDLLKDTVTLAEADALDICIFGGNIYDMRFDAFYECWNTIMNEYIPHQKVFSGKDAGDNIFLISGSFPWNKLYRTSFIKSANLTFQEIKSINDLYFVFMSYIKAKRIGVCKKRLIYYRVGDTNSLTINNDKEPGNIFLAYKKIKTSLETEGVYSIYKKALCRMFTWDLFTALGRMRSFSKYKYLVDRIKKIYVPEFQLNEMNSDYYLDEYIYSQFRNIITLSAEEYLFECWRNNVLYENEKKLFETEKTYLFKNFCFEPGSKIVVYGFGKAGKDIVRQIIDLNRYVIPAIIDNNNLQESFNGIPVIKEKDVDRFEYDYILIAIYKQSIYEEVRQSLILNKGISENIIIRM